MLAFDSRLPIVAIVCASGLLLVALIAWLLPSSVASSSLLVFGRGTLAAVVPALHAHRVVLLVLAFLGSVTALASLLELPYPGVGLTSVVLVAAQIAALMATAPFAVLVVALLLCNLLFWLLVVRIVIGMALMLLRRRHGFLP